MDTLLIRSDHFTSDHFTRFGVVGKVERRAAELLDDGPLAGPACVEESVDVAEIAPPDRRRVGAGDGRPRHLADQGRRAVDDEDRQGVRVRFEGLRRCFARLPREGPRLVEHGPRSPYAVNFVQLPPRLGAGPRRLYGNAVTVFFSDSSAHLPSLFRRSFHC
ncbi:hypothetical protein [Streptomyces sp. NPDC005251]|uniref:hypothetical protein n=1 Tax=unclassified Streptomyces TaxID=2593676 RepID=UPI0033AF78B6